MVICGDGGTVKRSRCRRRDNAPPDHTRATRSAERDTPRSFSNPTVSRKLSPIGSHASSWSFAETVGRSSAHVVAGAIGGIFWYGSSSPAVPTVNLLTVVADDWVKGNKEAPVTIVEYLDFECEACGAYYPVVKRLSEEFGNEVRFVSRYFPLPGHKNSMTSALAVEAAGRQGKYWEMYNIVFENQRDWGEKQSPDPKIFESYAKQIGLDMNQYGKDIDSQELKDRIGRDRKTGQKLNISGTPSFFLNGKKIENPRGYEDFKVLLQSAISQANKGNNE